MAEHKDPNDRINRGDKSNSYLGSTAFVGLRALDPLLQYNILFHGTGQAIIKFFGSNTFAQGPSANTGYGFIDTLQLSPYRLALFGMAVGTSVKQIVWKLFIGEEYMDLPTAGAVAAFNTVLNSANNLLAICQATGVSFGKGEGSTWDDFPYPPLVAGGALFVAGMLIETLSEVQRKAFKADKETAGKPCTTGLWALSRHINYFGYTLWRAGYSLAAGGWVWGAINGAFFLWDFGTRGCPMLDKYLENRYADMYHDWVKKTPYTLIPYVW